MRTECALDGVCVHAKPLPITHKIQTIETTEREVKKKTAQTKQFRIPFDSVISKWKRRKKKLDFRWHFENCKTKQRKSNQPIKEINEMDRI